MLYTSYHESIHQLLSTLFIAFSLWLGNNQLKFNSFRHETSVVTRRLRPLWGFGTALAL